MKLSSLKIKHRIAILTFVALASFIISIAINSVTTTSNTDRLSNLQNKLYPVLSLATVNEGLLIQLEQIIQSAVTTGEEENLQTVDAMVKTIIKNLDEIGQLLPSESSDMQRLKSDTTTYHQNATTLVMAFLADDIDFNAIKKQAADNAARYQNLVKDFKTNQTDFESQFTNSIESTITDANSAQTSVLLIGVVATILMVILGLLVNSSIITTLSNVTNSLRNISEGEGDLRSRIQYEGKDEIADLVYWFNQFVSKLQSSIADTKQTTESLSAVSKTLLNGSKVSELTVKEQTNVYQCDSYC